MEAVILSNGLDTNGQNTRFVRAAEKWGSHDDVIRALAIGLYDPASVIGRFQVAAEKFGNLSIRSVHRSTHIYQQMPADMVWTRSNENQIRALAAEADIIHLNNSAVAMRKLRLPRDKPVLLHHHGSLFRNNPRAGLQEAKNYRALQLVSTVDLMRVAPQHLYWAPTAYDIDWLQAFGRQHRRVPDGRIRVVQCPTDGRDGPYKSTSVLERAVASLQRDGVPLELIVVRDKPWLEALAIKATADIYFDQVKLGYGCNAIEAWGMGIPVIAGADPWTLHKMREVYGTDRLPFYEATEDTIADALLDLASSKVKRTKYAKLGVAHIRKFHDELPALTRLAELYSKAISEPESFIDTLVIPPTTFRASVPQVRVVGHYVTFVNGQLQTDNPYIASGLRQLAIRRPAYGIEEVA